MLCRRTSIYPAGQGISIDHRGRTQRADVHRYTGHDERGDDQRECLAACWEGKRRISGVSSFRVCFGCHGQHYWDGNDWCTRIGKSMRSVATGTHT